MTSKDAPSIKMLGMNLANIQADRSYSRINAEDNSIEYSVTF